MTASIPAPRLAWRDGTASQGSRAIPEECAVAMSYGRTTHAVMMATPADLEDFAVGFSLAEGVIARPSEIAALEVVEVAAGIELRMDLVAARQDAHTKRRRFIAGPTGCGLCGIDSLAEAMRAPALVSADTRFDAAGRRAARAAMGGAQVLNIATRAVHAAGFWTAADGLVALREDVGRHNALDKLAGALARDTLADALPRDKSTDALPRDQLTDALPRGGLPGSAGSAGTGAEAGAILLTSRVSVEMVQKAARIGAPVLVAVSAPTALAVRMAQAAGITLLAVARADGFEIFTHPERITGLG